MKRITMFLSGLMLMLSLTASAASKKKSRTPSARMQPVYVFGFASSFTDTLAYLTDVQRLDSAYILSKGLLADRLLYSLQLEGYLTEKVGMATPTVATFYSTKPKKIAKKYEKVKQMYQKNSQVKLVPLGKDAFRHEAEQYVDAIVTEILDTYPEADSKEGGAE